jgi:hypothetical protein
MGANRVEKFEIATVKRSAITEHPQNPRTINAEARSRLEKNLRRMGLLEPIIVNRNSMRVVSGHQRLSTLDKIKKTKDYELDVSLVDLNPAQELEQLVFMNNSESMGFFDTDELKNLLTVNNVTFENTGFSVSELAMELGLQFAPPPKAESVIAAPVPDTVTEPAQMDLAPAPPVSSQPSIKIVFGSAKQCDRFLKLLGVSESTRYVGVEAIRLALI